jgi:putative DNA primase/helicase
MIDGARLPVEIRESVRAVVWRFVPVPGREKPDKVPYQAQRPDQLAAVDNPGTWGSFDQALAVVATGRADGVGIVFGDGLVGVDLPHCRTVDTGAITPEAVATMRMLDSYAEVSPSGSGLHVLVRAALLTADERRLLAGGRRKDGVQMYADGCWFTLTGAHVAGTPTTIEERTNALAALHPRFAATNGKGAA